MNFLKILFNPIFLLAAGLHAGLLLIPVAGDSSEELVPAPDPTGESITVTRIPPKAKKPATAARQQAKAGQPSTAKPQAQSRQAQSGSQNSSGNGTKARGRNTANRQGARNNNPTNRSEQAARNSPTEIPVLSAPESDVTNNRNNSSDNNPTRRNPATQTPPTLVALLEGARSQTVPAIMTAFRSRLRYSVLRTTDPEVTEAKQAWLTSLNQQSGLDITELALLEKPLTISYPLIADGGDGPQRFLSCLNPLPKTGLIGVVVDANGAVLVDESDDDDSAINPALLRSSGYQFLDNIALRAIQAYIEFPNSSTLQVHAVPIEVDYDEKACISLPKLGVVPTKPTAADETEEEDLSPFRQR